MPRCKLILAVLSASLLACAAQEERHDQVTADEPPTPPPLEIDGSAYDAAATVELPAVPPVESPGLHNVYVLSEAIISGAEPEDPEALAQLADWGVKTILSVDGKVPDAETAEALGMRYVHVPIQYKGISEDELLKISKTFRELEGPFYVHCFHGKHRGPAAAAVGRVVLDGIPRDRAIAEMRQWCATSAKYEGLYATVAAADIPSGAATRAFDFGFESQHSFEGIRSGMILMARTWDMLILAEDNDWQVDPDHPDVDPLQQANQLHQLFEVISKSEETFAMQDDFRQWMEEGRAGSEDLVRALSLCSQDGIAEATWSAEAADAYARVEQSCTDCHGKYRN